MLYTSINTLNDDVLLDIFNYYRLDDEKNWLRRGWCKLAHVCRSWRHVINREASNLDVRLLCTNGTPGVDTLAHLTSLPLAIDYQYTTATIDALEEWRISQALKLRDRVRRAAIHIPSSSLHELLVLMDEPYPSLDHLSLLSTTDEDTSLILPETFVAPNLRYLTLSGISLPGDLTSLSSASLVTLTLANIRASSYFVPTYLVTLLQSSPQLEELSISFSDSLPRPSAERELFRELKPPVTLPTLKRLMFRGSSAYLDSLVAQMRAPRLQVLDVTFFNQLSFTIPHLSHFTNAIEGLKHPDAKIAFNRDMVSLCTRAHWKWGNGYRYFSLQVMCKPFDWQIDCAAQICRALLPVLSSAEKLILDSDGETPTIWPDGAVDGATWLELLRPFVGVEELSVNGCMLAWELSRALQLDNVDPELLPALSWLVHEMHIEHTFAPFNHTRQVAALRVPRLSQWPARVHRSPSPVNRSPSPLHRSSSPVHRSASPVHRSPSPVRRSSSPVRRSSSPVHRSPPPVHRSPSPTHRSPSPVRLPTFPLLPVMCRYTHLSQLVSRIESSFLDAILSCQIRDPSGYLSVPDVPPVRVEQDCPPPSRTTRSGGWPVKIRPPPPKHIRCRIRPSHKGAGSAWR